MYYSKGDANSYLQLQKQKSTNGRFFGKDLTNISHNEKDEKLRRGKSTKRSQKNFNKSKYLKNPSQKNLGKDRSRSKKRNHTPEFRETGDIPKSISQNKIEISKQIAKDKFKSKITKLVKKKEKSRVKKTEEFIREKLKSKNKNPKEIKRDKSYSKLSPLTTKLTEEEIITPVNKQPKPENKPVDLEKRARGIRKFDLNRHIDKKTEFSNNIMASLLQKVKDIEEPKKETQNNCFELVEEEACDYIFRDPKEVFDTEDASFYISEKVKNIRIQEEMESYEIDYSQPGAEFTSMKELNFAKIWQMMLKDIKKFRIRRKKIEYIQKEVNKNMRAILIDWLIDIHRKFKVSEPALYLTVHIIDKILEKVPVAKHRFQLLGITALFIASKYEDIYPPALADFSFVCADAYTEEDILLMEANVLKELNFGLIYTSPLTLLEGYFKEKKLEKKTESLIYYLQNIAFISNKMVSYSPSEKSAASIFLSQKILNKENLKIEEIAGDFGLEGKIPIVKKCAKEMVILLSKESKNRLTACKRKFKQEKYLSVSKIQICFKKNNEME